MISGTLVQRLLFLVFLLIGNFAIGAEIYPKILHGSEHDIEWTEKSFLVHSDHSLVQLELAPGFMISMGDGVQLEFGVVDADAGEYALCVNHGFVLAAIPGTDRIHALREGYYPVSIDSLDAADLPTRVLPSPGLFGMTQGFSLGNLVLTQQDYYLNRLKINITLVNSAIAGVINGLFRRRESGSAPRR